MHGSVACVRAGAGKGATGSEAAGLPAGVGRTGWRPDRPDGQATCDQGKIATGIISFEPVLRPSRRNCSRRHTAGRPETQLGAAVLCYCQRYLTTLRQLAVGSCSIGHVDGAFQHAPEEQAIPRLEHPVPRQYRRNDHYRGLAAGVSSHSATLQETLLLVALLLRRCASQHYPPKHTVQDTSFTSAACCLPPPCRGHLVHLSCGQRAVEWCSRRYHGNGEISHCHMTLNAYLATNQCSENRFARAAAAG